MSVKAKQKGTGHRRADRANRHITLETLAARATLGDKDALYLLCEQIAKDILFRVRSQLGGKGNDMNTEDVSQNVLLRVCENIHKLREPVAFRAWLGGIVTNESRRFLMQENKYGNILNFEDHMEAVLEDDQEVLPREYAELKFVREVVLKIIALLPNRQREAVMLHYYDELSVTEIAGAMEIPHQDVSRYLALARKRLKQELEKLPLVERISVGAAIPLGQFTSEILRSAASLAPENTIWVQNALAQCQEYIVAGSAVAAAAVAAAASAVSTPAAGRAAASESGVKIGLISSLISVASALVVTAGLWAGGVISPEGHVPPPSAGGAVITQGEIVFTGVREDSMVVNPVRADVWATNERGELEAQYWWITVQSEIPQSGAESAANSESPIGGRLAAQGIEALHYGEIGSIDGKLALMQENGEDGMYTLWFAMKDSEGSEYLLSREFVIK